jgi:6-pyruvoyltetrahydropterin/6-carboxytetrahydropterin synthase
MAATTLHLAKQNFKFSSAHFLIFDDLKAEMLHGHNYQVKVDLKCPSESDFEQMGYFIDFNIFKKAIKSHLDLWDEHILLPRLHKDMKYKISPDGKNYEIQFRDRYYSFPLNEVVWLNVTNTSVEQLSQILAHEFHRQFKKFNVKTIRVTVEETRGQSASSVVTGDLL